MLRIPQRLMAGLLAGALTLTAAAPALAKPRGWDDHPGRGNGRGRVRIDFKDWQDGYWANEALARLIFKGVIQGDPDGTVAPQRTVTRLEAAVMLVRLLGFEPAAREGKWSGQLQGGKWEFKVDGRTVHYEAKYRGQKFEFKWDQDGLKVESKGPEGKMEWHLRDAGQVPDWGRGYVQVAISQGFLDTSEGFLRILEPLDRLSATVMLVRAAGLEEEARERAGVSLPFTDAGQIPGAYRGYVDLAVENGLISGYPEGDFRPAALVTRAEWAALLDRFDRRAEEPVTAGEVEGILLAVDAGATPAITLAASAAAGGRTYPVAGDALIFVDGEEATLADLQRGDEVIAQLDETGTVIFMVKVGHQEAEPGVEPEEEQVQGRLVGAGRLRIGLYVDGEYRSYDLAAGVTIWDNGRRIELADLEAGDMVRLTLVANEVVRIERTDDLEVAVERSGRVLDLDAEEGSLLLDGDDGAAPDRVRVQFDPEEAVAFRDLQLDAGALARGQRLLVAGTWDGDRLQANSLGIDAEASAVTFSATLRDRDTDTEGTPESIRVSVGSRTETLPVASDVEVTVGEMPVSFAELEPGDAVVLEWNRGEVEALAVDSREAFTLSGRIRDADSDEIILTVDGRSARFSLAADLQVRFAGLPGTAADLRRGDGVLATVEDGVLTEVEVTDRSSLRLEGSLVRLNLSEETLRLRVRPEAGGPAVDVTVALTAETEVVYEGLAVPLSVLAVGQELEAEGPLTAGVLQAEALAILNPGN